jgi:hypothetical protein
MGTVQEDIIKSLEQLGGVGTLMQIFEEYSKIHPKPVFSSVRREIQQSSSDTLSKPKKKDLFFSAGELGTGRWGLRNYLVQDTLDPISKQVEENSKPPGRKETTVSRIIRITALASEIKNMADNKCQLCGFKIKLNNGNHYSEAHHIQPLGGNHRGPDIKRNILVVCPNCHIKCDYGLIPLNLNSIQNNLQGISQDYIDYHNNEIHGRIGVDITEMLTPVMGILTPLRVLAQRS